MRAALPTFSNSSTGLRSRKTHGHLVPIRMAIAAIPASPVSAPRSLTVGLESAENFRPHDPAHSQADADQGRA